MYCGEISLVSGGIFYEIQRVELPGVTGKVAKGAPPMIYHPEKDNDHWDLEVS